MKKIHEEIKKVFESKVAFGFLLIVGSLIVALLIFGAGVNVGFRKASFGRAWGENYEKNFGMKPGRMMMGKDNFPNANGAIGRIIKIELPNIIVEDKDGTEKVVLLKSNTKIQEGKIDILPEKLALDDFIVTIGSPNDNGVIEAKFIRLMPLGMPPAPLQNPRK